MCDETDDWNQILEIIVSHYYDKIMTGTLHVLNIFFSLIRDCSGSCGKIWAVVNLIIEFSNEIYL